MAINDREMDQQAARTLRTLARAFRMSRQSKAPQLREKGLRIVANTPVSLLEYAADRLDGRSVDEAAVNAARDERCDGEYCEHGLLRTQRCVRCVNEAARELGIR